jgi:hypothetical protein
LSTILKALRRLEQGKAAERERPLRDAVAEAEPEAPASRSRLVLFALAGLAAGVGLSAWLLRAPEEPSPAVAGLGEAPPAASAERAIPAAPPAEAVAIRVAEAPASVDAPPPTGPIAVAPPADPPPRLDSFPAPPIDPTPKRVVRIAPSPTAPPAELPLGGDGAVSGAVEGGAVSRRGEEPPVREDVRSAPALPRPAPRAPAVEVSVVRTVWHPKSERRTALLAAPGDESPREYREGDRVGALVLLRIEPSGVVFDREGVELRRGIGASARD